MTTGIIVKIFGICQPETAPIDRGPDNTRKGRRMILGRLTSLAPVALSVAGSLVAGLADVNWAGAGSVITGLCMAIGGGYWYIAQKRTRVYAASKAAELKVYRDSEEAKLKLAREAEADKLQLFRDSEAAKLKVLRAAAVAKIKIQQMDDEANKDSLSAQLRLIQEGMNEALRGQEEARSHAAAQAKLIEHQSQRIEDLNKKSHDARNEFERIMRKLEEQNMLLKLEIRDLRSAQGQTQGQANQNTDAIVELKSEVRRSSDSDPRI